MSASIHDIKRYSFAKTDALFIDTNVWLYIYGPQKQGDNRSRDYSGVLRKILQTECSVFTDVLILSEFINRYAKMMSDLEGIPPKEFKSYRQSSAFKPVAKELLILFVAYWSIVNALRAGLHP